MTSRMIQPLRYAVVGVLSNLSGYLVYLTITWQGVEPKTAMTGLYIVGAMVSFMGNRRWTFSHEGNAAASLVRFGIAHVLGYLLNLTLLVIFVDRLGYPHQWVQAAAIFIVAFFLFVAFRLFVFPPPVKVPGGAR
jgi:putative flippase GtrA